jgi:amidohydrolase
MSTDQLDLCVQSVLPHATAIRHDLHQHPELGHEEVRTSGVVQRELGELGIAYVAGLARGTGVLGWIPATTDPDNAPTIALRADMDALPIHETSSLGYKSENPGVMHACGHDGHTAILLGAARALMQTEHRTNNVLLIHQPAEEGGFGAQLLCKAGALDGTVIGKPVDLCYGLHGWPEIQAGQVSTRVGALLAATDEFDIIVRGRGGHAAYPHLAIDPIPIASQIVMGLQKVCARSTRPTDSMVVTVGHITGGAARNVIPDEVLLQGTMRTLEADTRTMGERRIREIAEGIARAHGAEAIVKWTTGYPVTMNDQAATDRFWSVAERSLGAQNVLLREHPSLGGEDFSYYGELVPSCFFFVGLRPPGRDSYPNLHTPNFDFNDDVLALGITLMTRLAL